MKNSRNISARDTRDWKNKYLAELEKQEKRERAHRQLLALLVKVVTRISLIAEGVDQQLDKQLSGLRHMLRDDIPPGRDLNTLVNALEGQVKRLGVVKTERAKVLANAFHSLVTQLKNLNTNREAKQKLKKFNKNLKVRSARIYDYSALINEYATLQECLLKESSSYLPKSPFWKGWFAKSVQIESNIGAESNTNDFAEDELKDKHKNEDEQRDHSSEVKLEKTASYIDDERFTNAKAIDSVEDLDLSNEILIAGSTVQEKPTEPEPPFIRLSETICEILSELLEQIEPPAIAKGNYNNAQKQVENGLNWYELVPTLEDISIVVVSTFDSYQKEFEQFLIQLNQRLSEASQVINASEKARGFSVEAGRKLSLSMREHVSSIQQSVESATELDQLKSEISGRLDNILSGMDKYQSDEQQREEALSDQLHALIDRVKIMEKNSADAEARIEEQRQRALRDVLTQLPNREAYALRLEQEFGRWQRYDRPLSLVVCDIDHFKRINDTYGHLAGDKVLRVIAKSLAKRLRKTDFIARYGGEEFVVLMPETEQNQALKVADGVRIAIAACPFHFKEKPVSITLSFGVTEFVDQDKFDAAFVRADKALYKAKDQGRNCCVLAV